LVSVFLLYLNGISNHKGSNYYGGIDSMEITYSLLFLISCIGAFAGIVFGVYLLLWWLFLSSYKKKFSKEKLRKKFWHGLIISIWIIFLGMLCEIGFTTSFSFSYEVWLCVIFVLVFCVFFSFFGVYHIYFHSASPSK